MRHPLIIGASALATIGFLCVAGCDGSPQEKVVERVVIRDKPVIVRTDQDRRPGDRPPGSPDNRR